MKAHTHIKRVVMAILFVRFSPCISTTYLDTVKMQELT